MPHRWQHAQLVANRGNLKPHFDIDQKRFSYFQVLKQTYRFEVFIHYRYIRSIRSLRAKYTYFLIVSYSYKLSFACTRNAKMLHYMFNGKLYHGFTMFVKKDNFLRKNSDVNFVRNIKVLILFRTEAVLTITHNQYFEQNYIK